MSKPAEGPKGADGSASGTSRKVLLALVVVLIAVVAWDVVIQMRAPDPPTPDVQARVAALFLFDAARAVESSAPLPAHFPPISPLSICRARIISTSAPIPAIR